jgi:hypothetical protein
MRQKEQRLKEVEASLKINTLQRFAHKRALSFLNQNPQKEKGKNNNMISSLKVVNVSRVEIDLNKQKKKLNSELLGLRGKRQLLQTSLALAVFYIGFSIYYGTKLDYRTRMYPWEYLLSRTTGELKHLLRDFDEIPLTTKGLITLMEAYYRYSKNHSVKFKKFLRKGKRKKENITSKLKNFFNKTLEEGLDSYNFEEQFAYWSCLRKTLEDFFNEKKRKYRVNGRS